MRSPTLSVLAIALGLTTACEEAGESCELASQHETLLEIGEGEDRLTIIDDLDRVPVSSGPQGGNHIWVGVLTSGVSPGRRGSISHAAQEGPDIRFDLMDSTGARVGDGGISGTPLKGDEIEAEIVGAQLYVDTWNEDGVDTLYTMRATLWDRCGTEIITERSVYLD